MLKTSIDIIKENGFTLDIPQKCITVVDYADDLALFANTPAQAKSLQQSLEQVAESICFYVNANKTDFLCSKQKEAIFTLSG